jgi:GNAT superfamily N-acetyltransferase
MQLNPRNDHRRRHKRRLAKTQRLPLSRAQGCGSRKIFRLVRGDELCGVIVLQLPAASLLWQTLSASENDDPRAKQKLSIINRVVIHPKYRTIGLGAKLIRETLPLAGIHLMLK